MLVASIGLAGCGGAKTSATPTGRDQLPDCCLRISVTALVTGHFEVFFDANDTAARMQVHENTKPRRLARDVSCADHAAFRGRSACLDGKGSLPPRDFGD